MKKAVQVTIDEALLQRLDSYSEVRTRGRSAVLREAVAEYLARKESEEIDRAYEAAYSASPPDEFDDWPDEAAWPE